MCGRFTLHATGRIKFDTSRQDVAALLVPRFNIAPRQDVLTVMQDGDQRVLLPARWGLIPSFRNQARQTPTNGCFIIALLLAVLRLPPARYLLCNPHLHLQGTPRPLRCRSAFLTFPTELLSRSLPFLRPTQTSARPAY